MNFFNSYTLELRYSVPAIKANRAIAKILESPNFLCLILLLQNPAYKAPAYEANRAIAHQLFFPAGNFSPSTMHFKK